MASLIDQNRIPGQFIIDIANIGLAATSALTTLGTGYRIKRTVKDVSLSAAVLMEAGNEVNKHAELFKDNFQQKFEGALSKCKKEYESIIAAMEKIHSFKKDTASEAKDPPKRDWKKLAWALEMSYDEFGDFEDKLEKSSRLAEMTKDIAQLVIVQVHAQQRELTPSEKAQLRHLKKYMGELLEAFHRKGVGNVMVFSLTEPSKPANATQVAEEAEEEADDDASITTAWITIHDPSETSLSAEPKKSPVYSIPPPPAALPVVEPVVQIPIKEPDVFEMYKFSNEPREKKANQTIFRFLGIPLQVKRTETEAASSVDKVPMSLADIQHFLKMNRANIARQSAAQTLLCVSPAISSAAYSLINAKTPGHPWTYRSHTWTIECFLQQCKEMKQRHFWKKRHICAETYILVLRGTKWERPAPIRRPAGCGPPPPLVRPLPAFRVPPPKGFTRRRSVSPSSSISSRRSRNVAAKFKLSQQETENVVNDYLASFSTLYDDVPAELRGAALKDIVLDSDDESDNDSDGSSRSRSLVDD